MKFRHSGTRDSANPESRSVNNHLGIPDQFASRTVRNDTMSEKLLMMRASSEIRNVAAKHGLLSPPLRGRGGEGGNSSLGACCSPPSLTLPRKGGGDSRAMPRSERPT